MNDVIVANKNIPWNFSVSDGNDEHNDTDQITETVPLKKQNKLDYKIFHFNGDSIIHDLKLGDGDGPNLCREKESRC